MLARRVCLCLLLTACAIACAKPEARPRATVAVLPFMSSAPVFIAQERGYFTADGLDVTIKTFDAAQPIALAVASNDADFGVTAFTGAFFNLAGKGALKVIAAQSREEPGFNFVAYVASNRAYEAGLRSPRDLAGKSVAISTVGSSFHYVLGMLSTKYGWPEGGVQLRPMQSIPNMVAALAGGQVDATILPANNAIQLQNDGSGKIIGWVHEQTPWQLGALFASTSVVRERRPVVEKFVRAYQRGLADYAAAFLGKDASGKREFGEAAEQLMPVLRKWVEPKPTLQVAEAAANYMDPQGRLLVSDIYKQVAWYQAQGLVDRTVKPDDFLDLSFVRGHFDVPKP